MNKIRSTVKKAANRTGRAFGLSEVHDKLEALRNDIKNTKDSVNDYWTFGYAMTRFSYFNEIAKPIHQRLFLPYKNCNNGKDVVLVACGPSADFYEPVEDAKHLAVNHSFLLDKVKFDYIFMHDSNMVEKYQEQLRDYDADKFIAFATNHRNAELFNASTAQVDAIGAKRFIISDAQIPAVPGGFFDVINPDIANGVIMDRGGGTVFSALQFLLYTNPRRIYLVGCDCTSGGYFKGLKNSKQLLLERTETLWRDSASFIRQYYPETEVISINPVTLKDLFEDQYTESFLKSQKSRKNH